MARKKEKRYCPPLGKEKSSVRVRDRRREIERGGGNQPQSVQKIKLQDLNERSIYFINSDEAEWMAIQGRVGLLFTEVKRWGV